MIDKTTQKNIRYGSVIMKCDCDNGLNSATNYQDKTLGKNMRIHNYCKLGQQVRCTCCCKQKDIILK